SSGASAYVAFESNEMWDSNTQPQLIAIVARLRPQLSTTNDVKEAGFSRQWNETIFPHALDGDKSPLPELSSIFAIQFYMSDIVRYHPNILSDDSTSTDPWVLDTFNRTGPAKFARLALSYLVGRDLRM